MSEDVPKTYKKLFKEFENCPKLDLRGMWLWLMEPRSNSDCIRHVHNLMRKCGKLPRQSWMKIAKDTEKASDLLKTGRDFVDADQIKRALEAYNESLCFAVDSHSRARAYAMRAMIYLQMRFYKFSLENMELAMREHGLSDKVRTILKELKVEMKDMKKVFEKDSLEIHRTPAPPTLSHPPNPLNPCIIDALEYDKDDHLITNIDLKPGDIVSMEKPFVKVVHSEAAYINCYNCGSDNFLNLRPCPYSTMVMFCSSDCEHEAWKGAYKYECPIIDGLFRIFDRYALVAIRLTLKVFTMFDTVNELKEFIDSIETEEDLLELNFEAASERDKLRALFSFEPYGDIRYNRGLILEFIGQAAVAWHVLKEFTSIEDILETEEHEDLFLHVLHRLLQYSKANLHAFGTIYKQPHFIASFQDDEMTCFKDHTQSTVSIMSNVSTRSCAPNLCNIYLPDMTLTAVIRPLQAGSRIFFSSLMDHWNYSHVERQKQFDITFSRRCECEACLNESEYPTSDEAKEAENLTEILCKKAEIFNEMYYRKLYTSVPQPVAEKLKGVIALALTNFDKHYPYKQFPDLVEYLKYCFDLMYLRAPLDCILIEEDYLLN